MSWFLTKENKVRFAYKELNTIEYDNHTVKLVVSMENNYNSICLSNSKIEEADIRNYGYNTEKDAQIEILRRERFDR